MLKLALITGYFSFCVHEGTAKDWGKNAVCIGRSVWGVWDCTLESEREILVNY